MSDLLTTFPQQMIGGKLFLVLIWIYNLNYFFFLPITTNNNPPIRICYENIVDIAFLIMKGGGVLSSR